MRDIAGLVRRYEVLTLKGMNTTDCAMQIYAELIQDGCICDEMKDKDFAMDLLLIGLEYEFADEETLEKLADDITLIALVDSMPDTMIKDLVHAILSMEEEQEQEEEIPFADFCFGDNFEQEEDVEEEDFAYIVTRISIDVDATEKETSIVNHIFYSIDDIADYIDGIGMNIAIDNVMSGVDLDTGHTDMLATEDAMDVLDEMGVDGMLIADQIPEGAVGVMAVITTNKQHDIIRYADVFAVFEATEYTS